MDNEFSQIGMTITLGGGGLNYHVVQLSFPLGATYPGPRVTVTGTIKHGFRMVFDDEVGRKIQIGRTPNSRHRVQVRSTDMGVDKIGCTQEKMLPVRKISQKVFEVDGVDLSSLQPRTPRSRVTTKNAASVIRHRYQEVDLNLVDAVRTVQRAVDNGDASWRIKDGRLVFLVMTEV